MEFCLQEVSKASLGAGPVVLATPTSLLAQYIITLFQATATAANNSFPSGNNFLFKDVFAALKDKLTDIIDPAHQIFCSSLTDNQVVDAMINAANAIKTAKISRAQSFVVPQTTKDIIALNSKVILQFYDTLIPFADEKTQDTLVIAAFELYKDQQNSKYAEDLIIELCNIVMKAPKSASLFNQQLVDAMKTSKKIQGVILAALATSFEFHQDPIINALPKLMDSFYIEPAIFKNCYPLLKSVLIKQPQIADEILPILPKLLTNASVQDSVFDLLEIATSQPNSVPAVIAALSKIEKSSSTARSLNTIIRLSTLLVILSSYSHEQAENSLRSLVSLTKGLHGEHLITVLEAFISINSSESIREAFLLQFSNKIDEWNKERDSGVKTRVAILRSMIDGSYSQIKHQKESESEENEKKKSNLVNDILTSKPTAQTQEEVKIDEIVPLSSLLGIDYLSSVKENNEGTDENVSMSGEDVSKNLDELMLQININPEELGSSVSAKGVSSYQNDLIVNTNSGEITSATSHDEIFSDTKMAPMDNASLTITAETSLESAQNIAQKNLDERNAVTKASKQAHSQEVIHEKLPTVEVGSDLGGTQTKSDTRELGTSEGMPRVDPFSEKDEKDEKNLSHVAEPQEVENVGNQFVAEMKGDQKLISSALGSTTDVSKPISSKIAPAEERQISYLSDSITDISQPITSSIAPASQSLISTLSNSTTNVSKSNVSNIAPAQLSSNQPVAKVQSENKLVDSSATGVVVKSEPPKAETHQSKSLSVTGEELKSEPPKAEPHQSKSSSATGVELKSEPPKAETHELKLEPPKAETHELKSEPTKAEIHQSKPSSAAGVQLRSEPQKAEIHQSKPENPPSVSKNEVKPVAPNVSIVMDGSSDQKLQPNTPEANSKRKSVSNSADGKKSSQSLATPSMLTGNARTLSTANLASSADKTGTLEMDRGALHGGWKSYEAFLNGNNLTLKKQKTKKKVEDEPAVISVTDISSINFEKKNSGFTLVMKDKKKLSFRAESDAERDSWVSAMRSAGAP